MNYKDRLLVPFALILFGVISFFVVARVFGILPLTVSTVTPNYFSVTGTGDSTGIPGKASASFGITVTEKSAEEAKNKANQVINKVVSEFRTLGVPENDIKTSNLSSYPERNFPNNSNEITGYTVSENLNVKFPSVEIANKAIDIATANGINTLGGLSYDLSDSAQNDMLDKAREAAIKNAKEKAQKSARAAGIRLGRVINMYEDQGYQPQPMESLQAQKAGALSEPTKLNPGENKTTTTVTLTYEIL